MLGDFVVFQDKLRSFDVTFFHKISVRIFYLISVSPDFIIMPHGQNFTIQLLVPFFGVMKEFIHLINTANPGINFKTCGSYKCSVGISSPLSFF
jgi:hypothetical protein